MVATAIGGGIAGALLTTTSQHTASPAASSTTTSTPAADSHAQDVRLCTAYAIINSATPKPARSGPDLLPSVSALQVAIGANPGANEEIRDALESVVDTFYATMASLDGGVRTRGLAEPPTYDEARALAVYDRAWDACRLGE
jgi:hypothetical protein